MESAFSEPLPSNEQVKTKQTEKTACVVMRSRVVELASVLGLLAVLSCKSSVNPIINQSHVSDH
jgi:hypothetical protein